MFCPFVGDMFVLLFNLFCIYLRIVLSGKRLVSFVLAISLCVEEDRQRYVPCGLLGQSCNQSFLCHSGS